MEKDVFDELQRISFDFKSIKSEITSIKERLIKIEGILSDLQHLTISNLCSIKNN